MQEQITRLLKSTLNAVKDWQNGDISTDEVIINALDNSETALSPGYVTELQEYIRNIC